MASDESGPRYLGGSILDAVSSHGGGQGGSPPPEGEEAQMARILTFLERWLGEPVLSSVILEHRGAGQREVLDTVLVKSMPEAAFGPAPSAVTSSEDDDGEHAGAAEAAFEARARRLCDQRPAATEVAHRFGLMIGEHASRLRRGDHPRYVLVAQSARPPGQLAQCEVWADLPGLASGAGGGGDLLALRAVPDFDRGPLLRAPSLMRGRVEGQQAAATYTPQPMGPSAADVVRAEATSAGLVRVLTRHIDQIMKTQGRTMDASLGAMAALNDKLLERTHLLESQHTETLKMQHELHRKWLQAESDRVRSETLAGVEADIQRAKNAQEQAKGEAFTKVVDMMRPAAAALTAKFHGADLVMRFLNSFPDGALEMIWPMLTEEQQAMVHQAAELDTAMMDAIKRASQGTTNVVLGAVVPDGGAAAPPETGAEAPPAPAAPRAARHEQAMAEPVAQAPASASVEAEHAEDAEEPPPPVAQRRPPTTAEPVEPSSADAAPACPTGRYIYAQCAGGECTGGAPLAMASGDGRATRVSGPDSAASSQAPASGAAPADAPAATSASPVFRVRGTLPSPVTLSPADSEATSLPDPRQTDLPFETPTEASSSRPEPPVVSGETAPDDPDTS